MNTPIPNVLQTIADSVRVRLEARQKKVSFQTLRTLAEKSRTPHAFSHVFAWRDPAKILTIAEIKFTSPALGVLGFGNAERAVKIARSYLQGGATALSILTEEDHFQGSEEYLRAVRTAEPNALLLMKDFILDEYQILEARVNGADCILLIVSLLGIERTKTLMKFAQAVGLSQLIEVHDEEELAQAVAAEAFLIGINNRNLKTLEVSLDTSFRLAKTVSSKCTLISESGIKTGEEMKKLSAAGFSGFLIGSSLMTSPEPGEVLAQLLKEAQT